MNLINITKISRYCGFFLALLVLAVVLPTADAQDNYITDSYFPPKPENVVPNNRRGLLRTTEPAPEVWMPDADLRAAVKAELSAMDPPLTLTQANLTALLSIESDHEVNGRSISNLKGLEYATRLTWLFLRGNSISNISVLSNLTNIQSISLEENNLSDISILSNLTALTHLNVGLNTITDISALSDLTGMRYIYLSGNNVTDISALSDLTSLHRLYLEGNNISDISALSDLTELTILTLGRNNATDIENLPDTISGNNTLSDISHLSRLVKLEELYISSNSISDISHLSGLTKLEILNLGGNSVSSLTALSNLIELEHLYLWNNSISDISPIAGLTNLQSLDLRWNSISDISYLSDLDNVEQLFLASNIINIITALFDMNGLVRVDLTQNPVWNIPANVHTVNTLRNERSVEVLIDDLVTPAGGFPTDLDVTEPTVSITVPEVPQNSSFDVTVTFNETVSGFELIDLDLDPTSVASISSTAFEITENDTTYKARVTPTTSGEVTFSVEAGVAIDGFYNPNLAATSESVTIDLIAPGVSISGVPSGIQAAPFDISIVFTEEVDNFVEGDVSFGGTGEAKVTDLDSTDDITFTAEITPVRDGDITLSVPAAVATDAAGNQNTPSTTQTVTVDAVEPGVTLTVPSGTQNDAFEVTFTFTQPITGFVASDVVLGGLSAEISEPEQDSTDEKIYTATITPTLTTPGNITIDVPANRVTNDIGTPNIAATTQTVPVDLPPNVSLTVTSGTQNTTFEVSVVFTEAVSGFDLTELVLDPTTVASILSTAFETTDNIIYTAEITPVIDGNVTFSVAAGVATDDAGNENTAATDLLVPINVPEPEVSITVPSGTQNAAFEVTFTFTVSVLGFNASDVVLSGVAAEISEPQQDSTDEKVYTATITPTLTTPGNITFDVPAGTVTNDVGTPNDAATTQTVSVDLPPNVSISGIPSTTQNASFDISVVFTEAVNDFVKADITFGGTGEAKVTDLDSTDDITFTAEITPVRDGDITLSIAAGVATDAAGNQNTASTTTQSIPINVPEPEVSITVPSGTQNDAFEVTFTFTESVSGFDASDVVLGDLSAEITQPQQDSTDEKIYTATITPIDTSAGNITIDVPADAVTNKIGTPNDAATRQTVPVDLPPNVSLTVPSGTTQNGPFDVSVVFTEVVNDFVADALVLGGSAMASITPTSFTTTDHITYTAEIIPTLSGDVTFDIDAGVATDANNLDNTAATQLTVTVDLFVEIPDRNLSRYIRNRLDLGANASVTESQMASLTSITYDSQNRPNYRRIRNLTGLEYAINLETLQLRYNRFSDLSPIVNLTNLRVLGLAQNNIDSISFVLNLTNLEELYLWRNDIEHISGLEDLTALRCLSVRHNPILNYAANRATRDILKERLGSKLKIDNLVDDTTAPSVTISAPLGVMNLAFEAKFTFTEPISGFDASDVVLGGLSAEITQPQQDSTDEKIYRSVIIPSETVAGNITIDIPENAVTDRGDNGNTAATTLTVSVNLPPEIGFGIPSDTQYGRFVVQIIFSEPVTGFIADDLIIGGTATAEVRLSTGSTASVYNVRITPTSPGDLIITVPAEVARDLGYNWNIATSSESVSVALDFAVEVPDANLAAELRHQLDLDDDDDITKSQILTLTAFDYILPPRNEWIYNISGLEHATNLKSLNLRSNRVSDIELLEDLTNLTSLRLRGNFISNIDVLENLTSLTYLDLRNNDITDINPLAGLTELTVLLLEGNTILDTSPIYPLTQGNLSRVDITVSQYPPWDVNEDGSVDATDSALVTAALGQTGNAIVNSRTDVNGDGTVDQDDLTLVTDNLDTDEAAPSSSGLLAVLDQETLMALDRGVLELYLNTLRAESDGSLKYLRAIAILERVLEMTRPKETQLLANYPNPFNPETWIPYHLANASKVRITIYDVHGTVVRRLDLGHQREGYYTSHSRAAYWDGRNDVGERIASGVYFYQLHADNVSLLRKMVILK